jgi:hypothetical protein
MRYPLRDYVRDDLLVPGQPPADFASGKVEARDVGGGFFAALGDWLGVSIASKKAKTTAVMVKFFDSEVRVVTGFESAFRHAQQVPERAADAALGIKHLCQKDVQFLEHAVLARPQILVFVGSSSELAAALSAAKFAGLGLSGRQLSAQWYAITATQPVVLGGKLTPTSEVLRDLCEPVVFKAGEPTGYTAYISPVVFEEGATVRIATPPGSSARRVDFLGPIEVRGSGALIDGTGARGSAQTTRPPDKGTKDIGPEHYLEEVRKCRTAGHADRGEPGLKGGPGGPGAHLLLSSKVDKLGISVDPGPGGEGGRGGGGVLYRNTDGYTKDGNTLHCPEGDYGPSGDPGSRGRVEYLFQSSPVASNRSENLATAHH